VLSLAYFIVLFILGPIATNYGGLAYALGLILPFHAIGLAILASWLIVDRRNWRMGWRQLIGLIFECAVCPGCFVNICRKLSLGFMCVPGDAIIFALDQDNSPTTAPLTDGLNLIFADLAEFGETRPEDDHLIQTYVERLSNTEQNA
jgi:hypothetical protein